MSADSFLSRWSKRKQQGSEAVPASAELNVPDVTSRSMLVPPAATAAASPLPTAAKAAAPAEALQSSPAHEQPADTTELPPVESLTPQSDFRPFMKPDVDPAIRNQAMKSLFRDPHFNVMDMMDVYVDDYSIPDPIPESMLRQMTQSRMLKLFDDLPDEEEKKTDSSPEEKAEAMPEADVQGTEAQDPAELSQKAPDTTNCPTLPDGVESDPQQEKPG